MRREVKYGEKSRVDILLESDGRPPCYVEVKNVHLSRTPGLAEFPDCVTARGARHLAELSAMVAAGARAVMVYLVQRGDAKAFALARDIDPKYAAAFRAARAAGVEAFAFGCRLTPETIFLDGTVPIIEPSSHDLYRRRRSPAGQHRANQAARAEGFAGMRAAGRLAAEALDLLAGHVRPGVTTAELDRIALDFATAHNAVPAPLYYRGYPKAICTSINHVVCHGIPADKPLKEGEIVNIDVTLILDGWHGDSSRMYPVGAWRAGPSG
jgi:hypothetical protein